MSSYFMKVILLKEIKGLGRAGEIKEVSDGYAGNFLLPKKLAVMATPTAIQHWARLKDGQEKKKEKQVSQVKELAKKLSGLKLTIARKSNEQGHLFASVNEQKVVELLAEQGLVVDKKRIIIEKPVKEIGEHQIKIDLGKEIGEKDCILEVKSLD